MIILPETRDSMFFLRQILSLQEFLEITNCIAKKVTVKRIPQVNQTDYISNTTVSSGIVRQTCRIAYRYICRHNISIGKGETPLFRVEQVETHTPPSRAAHPLNSLNTSQKNTPKSASVFFSSLFFLPLFPCFFYPSTLVLASLHPASHCFPLLFSFSFASSFFIIFFLSLKIKIFICL